MRCHYCDRSDHNEAPSLYQDSLTGSQIKCEVHYRPSIDRDVCTVCWGESEDKEIVEELHPAEIEIVEDAWDDVDEDEIPRVDSPDEDYN